MADDLIMFVKRMDQCWIEHRFDNLASYVADDVVIVAPGGRGRTQGLDAAVESYREFMRRSQVHRFNTHAHTVTERESTAIVEYDWDMAWSDQGTSHEANGREILVLARRQDVWRVVWRTQLPS